MAGVETTGGACPKCARQMMQKHDTGTGWFNFDACPWCGFIYSTPESDTPNPEKAWASILEHFGVETKQELISSISVEEYTPSGNKEFFPSIFNHSNEEGTLPIYNLLWREVNEDEFQIAGLRVHYTGEDNNDEDREGYITGYEEGVLHVQWKANAGSKLPDFDYEATALGTTIQLITE